MLHAVWCFVAIARQRFESVIFSFFGGTLRPSDLRIARCTTEKWPRPMAFSTV